MGRQNLANKEARKKTLFLWQKETNPYIRLPKKESHKYVFMKKKKLLKQLIVGFVSAFGIYILATWMFKRWFAQPMFR